MKKLPELPSTDADTIEKYKKAISKIKFYRDISILVGVHNNDDFEDLKTVLNKAGAKCNCSAHTNYQNDFTSYNIILSAGFKCSIRINWDHHSNTPTCLWSTVHDGDGGVCLFKVMRDGRQKNDIKNVGEMKRIWGNSISEGNTWQFILDGKLTEDECNYLKEIRVDYEECDPSVNFLKLILDIYVGKNKLHGAVMMDDHETAALLLSSGACVDAQNEEGKIARELNPHCFDRAWLSIHESNLEKIRTILEFSLIFKLPKEVGYLILLYEMMVRVPLTHKISLEQYNFLTEQAQRTQEIASAKYKPSTSKEERQSRVDVENMDDWELINNNPSQALTTSHCSPNFFNPNSNIQYPNHEQLIFTIEAYVKAKQEIVLDASDLSIKRAQGSLCCLKQCSNENPERSLLILYALLKQSTIKSGGNLNKEFLILYASLNGITIMSEGNLNKKLAEDLHAKFLFFAGKHLEYEFEVNSQELLQLCNHFTTIIMNDQKISIKVEKQNITKLGSEFIDMCENPKKFIQPEPAGGCSLQ